MEWRVGDETATNGRRYRIETSYTDYPNNLSNLSSVLEIRQISDADTFTVVTAIASLQNATMSNSTRIVILREFRVQHSKDEDLFIS